MPNMARPGEPADSSSVPPRITPGWGERYKTGLKPDVSQPRCGWALIGSAFLGVIGALTPWAYIHGDEVHRTDIGVQVGLFPLASALFVATMGALIVLRRGQLWVSVSVLVVTVVSLVIMTFVDGSIGVDEARKYSTSISDVSVGYGVWLTVCGALLGVAFAVWALLRRTAIPANEARA
jgi:hypothetical protein